MKEEILVIMRLCSVNNATRNMVDGDATECNEQNGNRKSRIHHHQREMPMLLLMKNTDKNAQNEK
jgi:hypothetical protein